VAAGMDHAGIATQSCGGEAARGRRQDQGRLRPRVVIDKVWDWKRESGGTIGWQMRAIGDGVGLEPRPVHHGRRPVAGGAHHIQAALRCGLIYRAERLVNWSPVLETAVSDLEVKYEDVEGELVSFRYGSMNDDEPHIVVATTRVETILRRHRDCRASRRRALPPPSGREDVAASVPRA